MRFFNAMITEAKRDIKSRAKRVAEIVFSKEAAIFVLLIAMVVAWIGIIVLTQDMFESTPINIAASVAYFAFLYFAFWLHDVASRAKKRMKDENKEVMSTLKGEDYDDLWID